MPSIIVSGADVRDGKPSPEGYLRGAAALKVPIADCVIFEDSPAGVAAARAAHPAQIVIIGAAVAQRPGELVLEDLRRLRWTGAGLAVQTT